jgi:hypothetical protein
MNSLTIGAKADSFYPDELLLKHGLYEWPDNWVKADSLYPDEPLLKHGLYEWPDNWAKADSFYPDQPHAKAWGYMNSLTIGLKPIHFIRINPMLKHGVI